MFETFDHTADIGLRITAASLPELFSEAARGVTSLIVENPEAVEPRETVVVEKNAAVIDDLLFDWLDELLYQFECKSRLFAEFDVAISGTALRVECRGEKTDPARHRLAHEVKAITYHGFAVTQTSDGWQAEMILDI